MKGLSYDPDDEIRKKYKTTLQRFIDTYWLRDARDSIRGELIGEILQRKGDKVIAVSPMYYSTHFSKYLKKKPAFGIELQDTPENIFERLIFTLAKSINKETSKLSALCRVQQRV